MVCPLKITEAADGSRRKAHLAEGEFAIKCRFQSKRALICIQLQLFPSTFRERLARNDTLARGLCPPSRAVKLMRFGTPELGILPLSKSSRSRISG